MLTGEARLGWVKMASCYSPWLLHSHAERAAERNSLRGSWEEEGRERGGSRRGYAGNTDPGQSLISFDRGNSLSREIWSFWYLMKVLMNILIFHPTSDSYGQEMSYGKQNKATYRAIVIIFQAVLANRILKLLKTFVWLIYSLLVKYYVICQECFVTLSMPTYMN